MLSGIVPLIAKEGRFEVAINYYQRTNIKANTIDGEGIPRDNWGVERDLKKYRGIEGGNNIGHNVCGKEKLTYVLKRLTLYMKQLKQQ